MAEQPATAYPGQSAGVTTAYPHGSARNDVAADDRLGTPWIANLINDIWGFHQALLVAGGVTPSGAPDTALASDKLTALQALIAAASGTNTGGIIESSDTPANLLTQGFLELKEGVRFVSKTTYASLMFTIGLGNGDVGNTFGLPAVKPRVRPNYEHPGAWVEVAPATPPSGDASPHALAFNPINGDQWYLDSNLFERLYFKAGGVGSWVSISVVALGLNNAVALALDWKREEIWLGDGATNELHQINYDGSLIRTYTNVQLTDVDVHVETGTVWITIDSGPATGLFRLDRSHSVALPIAPAAGWPVETPSAVPNRLCVDQDSGDVTVFSPKGQVTRVAFGDTEGDDARFYAVGEGDQVSDYVQVAGAGVGGVAGIAVDPGNKDLFAATTEGNNVFISADGDSAWTLPNLVPGILQPNAIEFNQFDGSLWVAIPSPTASTPGTMYRLAAVQTTNGVRSYIKT